MRSAQVEKLRILPIQMHRMKLTLIHLRILKRCACIFESMTRNAIVYRTRIKDRQFFVKQYI